MDERTRITIQMNEGEFRSVVVDHLLEISATQKTILELLTSVVSGSEAGEINQEKLAQIIRECEARRMKYYLDSLAQFTSDHDSTS